MSPDWSDWEARKPSGTRKNAASQSMPGPSSRYGVSRRCRWRNPNSAGDQVLPGGEVLLVVQRLRVEDVDAVERLLRREDERVARDRRVVLQRPFLGPVHGRDVVDPGDVALRVAGLHQALNL